MKNIKKCFNKDSIKIIEKIKDFKLDNKLIPKNMHKNKLLKDIYNNFIAKFKVHFFILK